MTEKSRPTASDTRSPAPSTVWLGAPLIAGCVQFSPFETDLDDDERDQTERNLARIEALPTPTGAWRFALIADNHHYYDALEDVVASLNTRDDLAFVLHAGDFTDAGLRQEYRWTLERLRELRAPFLVVIGNHDAISNGQQIYRSMFGEYDFAFAVGGVRFVCFNSNELEFGSSVPDLEWLSGATAPAVDGSPVIAVTHHPARMRDYADVLRDNGVLALMAAHQHAFSLSSDLGFTSVVVDRAADRRWAVITVDGRQLTVEDCSSAGCLRREP